MKSTGKHKTFLKNKENGDIQNIETGQTTYKSEQNPSKLFLKTFMFELCAIMILCHICIQCNS